MKHYIRNIPIYGAKKKEVDVESFKNSVLYLFKKASEKVGVRSSRLRPTQITLRRYVGPIHYRAEVNYYFSGYESCMVLYRVPMDSIIPEDYWCTTQDPYVDGTYLDILVSSCINPKNVEIIDKLYDAFKNFIISHNTIEGISFKFSSNKTELDFADESTIYFYSHIDFSNIKLPEGFSITYDEDYGSYYVEYDRDSDFEDSIEADCIQFELKTSALLYDYDKIVSVMEDEVSKQLEKVIEEAKKDIDHLIKRCTILSNVDDMTSEISKKEATGELDIPYDITIHCYYGDPFIKFEPKADVPYIDSMHLTFDELYNINIDYLCNKIKSYVELRLTRYELDHRIRRKKSSELNKKYDRSHWDGLGKNIIYQDFIEDEE